MEGQDQPEVDYSLVGEMVAEAESRDISIAESYRITTIVPYANKDCEVNTYTMPVQDLDEFFQNYHKTGEIVVDVQPTGDT